MAVAAPPYEKDQYAKGLCNGKTYAVADGGDTVLALLERVYEGNDDTRT